MIERFAGECGGLDVGVAFDLVGVVHECPGRAPGQGVAIQSVNLGALRAVARLSSPLVASDGVCSG